MGIYTEAVQKLYVAYFNRPADPSGLTYWENVTAAQGGSTAAISTAFSQSAEYQAKYANMNNDQIVNTIYQNLFGRGAEAAGLTFWALALNEGRMTIADAVTNIAAGAQGTDATAYANKVTGATSFTAALDTSEEILAYSGASANAIATTWLSGITDDASLTTQTAAIDTTVSSVVSTGGASTGSTFTLTTGVDVLTGTSNNDTIIADNSGTTDYFTAADQIDGGAGTDTLKIYNAATDTVETTNLSNVSKVENIYLQSGTLTTATTWDISGNADVTSVEINSPTNIANAATWTLKSGAAQAVTLTKVNSAGASTVAFDGATGVTLNGVATTGTITLDNASTTATSFDLTTTGSGTTGKSTVTVTNTGTQMNTLNIMGAGDIAVTDTDVDFKTYSAATATGSVSLDISGKVINAATKYTGGAGEDTLTVANDALGLLTAGSQLDGGAGDADVLAIKDTALTATELTALNATTGFETLSLNAAISVDASKVTKFTSYSNDTAAAKTISNMATGSKVAFTVAEANAIALSGATGVNDLAVTIGTGTSTGFTVADLTIGQTAVSLISDAKDSTQTNTITALKNADNSTYTITGDNNLTIGSMQATATGSKVDASGFTGKLDVTGSGKTDILIGGSAADTFDGGAVTHTVTSVTGVAEVFTATFTGDEAGNDTTIAFDGVTVTLNAAAIGSGVANLDSAINIATEYAFDYNAAANETWTAVHNAGTATVTFTKKTAGALTDVASGDFVVTANTADDTAVTVTAAAPSTQGVTAVTAVAGTVDQFTGNGGADTFAFSTADVDTTAGEVTAIITDFVSGTDKIKVTNGADAGAGSATNYVEATSVAASMTALLTAADTALNGTVDYYVGQVGSDSYLVTDADGTGYTNVIKMTGVALDGIAATDLIA